LCGAGKGKDVEREGTMNEHDRDPTGQAEPHTLTVLETDGGAGKVERSDLILDLSGIRKLDVANLALLLTTQQKAEQEDREVWQALHAMGLGRFFKPFPASQELVV
jgi:hypothetical protein